VAALWEKEVVRGKKGRFVTHRKYFPTFLRSTKEGMSVTVIGKARIGFGREQEKPVTFVRFSVLKTLKP